jgi:hypothetical protein
MSLQRTRSNATGLSRCSFGMQGGTVLLVGPEDALPPETRTRRENGDLAANKNLGRCQVLRSSVASFWMTVLGCGAFALIPAGAGAADAADCVVAEGDFTSFLVFGPECESPVGFCTRGLLTGELEATYDFVMTSSVPSPTPEHPSRVVYTGYSVVQTEDGAMFGEDSGEMWFEGNVAFMTTVGVVGGDECFEGAAGEIVASGVIDLVTGDAVGTYTSEICNAVNCFRRSERASERAGRK